MSVLGRALALPVLGYRRWIRPLRASAAMTCRFEPSCSAYAVEALTVWGPIRGGWLALRRLGKCQPWGGVGLDPVPPRESTASAAPKEQSPSTEMSASPSTIRRSPARTSG